MSLNAYGLLKCKAIGSKPERDLDRPHFHIHAVAGEEHYRIAINIMSDLPPSELLFYTMDHLDIKMLHKLNELPYGFYYSQNCSLDYIRGDLGFKKEDMKSVPSDRPGPDNDLNEKLSKYINEAILTEDTDVYIFGTKWKSNNFCKADRIFGFQPSMGIHNVHMNQGNTRIWKKDDGVWQDGGILIRFPDRWVGVFLAFQSQSWNTDNCTGRSNKKHKGHIKRRG